MSQTHTHSPQNSPKKTLVDLDGYLTPYLDKIEQRRDRFAEYLHYLEEKYESFEHFSSWHQDMGIQIRGSSLYYREWAPAAKSLHLVGDFNDWNPHSHPLQRKEDGIWEIALSPKEMPPLSEFKVRVESSIGVHDRIPIFAKCLVQKEDHSYNTVLWTDDGSDDIGRNNTFTWSDKDFTPQNPLIIYEAHVGMATEEHKVGSYREFADNILPYIADMGYTCVQLMAIMEHPYYGSYGYHVSSIYAASSRFGTPLDLKYLINKAHGLGLMVIIDAVHSHAIKNFHEGLNQFDGTDHQFFHAGERGTHILWDSKLYNYGKEEVQRFLLSNLRFWMEEYHVDGFRFDGITSMLYTHHGHYKDFVHYDMYFNDEVDLDAILYMQMANKLCHDIKPWALCVAEDMSGMPGTCRPQYEGGLGFDYRLGMGIPDHWIKVLKEQSDEEWDLYQLYQMLTGRRYGEASISYCESHDQALVGDKTLAFRLMDQEMYWYMSVNSHSLIIDRGLALHKLIRFITMVLGGEGYLTFMGNEFGHPEWIDFPRKGNNFSYQYARRLWSLKDNPDLKYKYLLEFEKKCLSFLKAFDILSSKDSGLRLISVDIDGGVLVFEKSCLVFVVSFNPSQSFYDYKFGVTERGSYSIVCNSDRAEYGGHARIDEDVQYQTNDIAMHGCEYSLSLYVVHRTAIVLRNLKYDKMD